MTRIITTTISEGFHSLCKENNIKWCEALRVGISIMLSEIGIIEYDNKINIIRKLHFFIDETNRLNKRLLDIEKRSSNS